MSRLRLVVLDGPDRGNSFELSGAVVVGRDATAGIVLQDAEVSRRHASFSVVEGAVEVEDLGSMNGTWVAGRQIGERCTVEVGGKVRVGRTLFQLVSPAPETRAVDEPATEETRLSMSPPEEGSTARPT